jgi:ADP-ribosylglycohydrolase
MHMPGGGRHIVGKGQITDDGELTLTLYRALCDTNGRSLQDIAETLVHYYSQWYDSAPFDIGNTCETAFLLCRAYVQQQIKSLYKTQ